MSTPFDIHRYSQRLYERRGEGVILTPREVAIGTWRPSQHRCHENVTTWCAHASEDHATRGWLFFHFEYLLPFVRFTAHSAVTSPQGVRYDITPSMASQAYPFISAQESEQEYALLIEGA
ncbi:MAG: hypothetical protein L0219_02115 [Phycisphaerales bacterium]|nr:hypothetical protein [Phycisphaerales bacterium]